LLQITGRDVQLFGKKALAGFGYDQVNALDSRVVFEEFEGFLRENCSAGPGYAHGYDLFFLLSHGQFVDRFSVAMGLRQVKIRGVHARDGVRKGATVYSRFPPEGERMTSAVPMQTVVEFIKRINAGNVDKLCELMTEDHVFQDALGKRFIGRETLRGGWKMYYEMVSDYKIRGEQFFVDKNMVAVFGTASGTSKRDGKFSSEGFWDIPAAWKATVHDGRVAEWCVYAESSRA
jgi:hypothetical protein